MRRTEKRQQGARKRSVALRKHLQEQEIDRLTTVHAKRVEKVIQAKRKLEEAQARKPVKQPKGDKR